PCWGWACGRSTARSTTTASVRRPRPGRAHGRRPALPLSPGVAGADNGGRKRRPITEDPLSQPERLETPEEPERPPGADGPPQNRPDWLVGADEGVEAE